MSAFIVTIDEEAIKDEIGGLVRGMDEDALNVLLEEEADDLIGQAAMS